jgi:hypothetical protein
MKVFITLDDVSALQKYITGEGNVILFPEIAKMPPTDYRVSGKAKTIRETVQEASIPDEYRSIQDNSILRVAENPPYFGVPLSKAELSSRLREIIATAPSATTIFTVSEIVLSAVLRLSRYKPEVNLLQQGRLERLEVNRGTAGKGRWRLPYWPGTDLTNLDVI